MVVNYKVPSHAARGRSAPVPRSDRLMSRTAEDTIQVILPDGSVRELHAGATAADLAAAIGPGLALTALAFPEVIPQ